MADRSRSGGFGDSFGDPREAVWAYERDTWLEARDPFREDFEGLDRELEHLGYEAYYPVMELGGLSGPLPGGLRGRLARGGPRRGGTIAY